MKFYAVFNYVFGSLIVFQVSANIEILYTAALIDQQFERRKVEYIKAIDILNSYGFSPYIVDSCKKNERSFFESHAPSSHVYYAGTNNLRIRNKGVNEVLSLIKSINHFHFNDTDLIVVFTGRYHFKTDIFFKILENNPKVSVFAKKFSDGQVFFGCFAMRYSYLKEMLTRFDLYKMEREMINVERVAADYIQGLEHRGISVMYMDNLDLSIECYGDGHYMHLDY